MKGLIITFAVVSSILMSSCGGQQGLAQEVSSVFPTQEATVLAESMASKLGLNALQKSSVYNTLLNYYNSKKDLYTRLKSNALTQAAFNLAESKLGAEKNTALKSIMAGSTQLAGLAQFFGIQ